VRVAAVDCGTNSVRLLIADVLPGRKVDVLRQMRVVRLGEGVDRTGELSPQALERTRVALVDYAATCRQYDVERIRMVATSATRDARNRSAFTEMVEVVLGVTPDVVSGAEEAALSFTGATGDLRDNESAPAPYLVIDIGGGSTEVVIGSAGVQAALSVDVGCVRLTERHLWADPPTAAQIAAARVDVMSALDQVAAAVPVEQARTAIGLAGSVTTVAALALGLPAYDSEAIHLSRLSARHIRVVSERLLGMTRAQRADLPVMHPGRVDVIGGGALVLEAVVERFGLDEVLVSERDILDGIALSVVP